MKNLFKWTTALFLLSFSLNAQNPASILAPRYSVSANYVPLPTSSSTPNGYSGQSAQRVQNIQVDPQGKILFFIVDENIYDRQGKFFAQLEIGPINVNGSIYLYNNPANGTSEINVVPVPGECQEYYIITNSPGKSPGTSSGQRDVAYGKIRVEYANGQLTSNSGYYKTVYGVTTFQPVDGDFGVGWMSPLFDFNNFIWTQGNLNSPSVRTAITRQSTNGKRFLFLTSSLHLWRYEITNSGIINPTQILDYSSLPGVNGGYAQNYERERGEMEVVTLENGNFRLAYPFNNVTFKGIIIMDISPVGNVISSSLKIQQYANTSGLSMPGYIRGLEFSKTGNRLYVTHRTNLPSITNAIDQLDVSGATIVRTPLTSTGMSDFANSQLEIDAAGDIYMVNASRMARISNAEALGASITWANSAMSLGFGYNLSSYPVGTFQSDVAFLLQDQIDGENYSSHFIANTACCIANSTYDKAQFTATVNATWRPGLNNNPVATSASNTVFIKEELRIPAGRTITIRNMVFRFAPGARVIIENGIGAGAGGRLILDNTTFTNDTTCSNQLWQGVEVWGNTNVSQQSSSQGRLVMINNASIQNAHVGALLTKRTTPNAFWGDNNRNGGVVQAVNSSFINNNYGVYFAQYQSTSGSLNNISYFHNTRFEWNTLGRPTNSAPNTHAYLNRVRGVNFRGCAFNVSNLLFASNITSNTTGIYSLNSQFYVDEFCSVFTQGSSCSAPIASTFLNLGFGARTSNFSQHSYSINKSIFTNCQFGIHTSSAKLPRITRNTFRVREIANAQSAGLVLNFSTGYVVQENTFEEFNNTAVTNGSGQSYGILVHNSDSLHNQIYRNTFQNLKIGGQTQARNGATFFTGGNPPLIPPTNPPSGGLQWKCNTFLREIYTADLALANGSMDYDQGYLLGTSLQAAINGAANNKFSLWGEGTTPIDHDLNVTLSSNPFKYVYLANNLETPDNYTTLRVSAVPAQFMTVPVSSTANSCPTKLGKTFGDLSGILDDHAARKSVLTNQIVSASGAQLLALKNELAYTNSLISETRNEISSRMQLDTSEFASPVDLENFLTAQNNVESKLHLIYANMDKGVLNNNTLVGTIANSISTNEKAFITILEELGSSINVADAISDPAMYTRIANIANSQNDVMTAAKAKALLIVVGETADIEDFWPLDGVTRSQIFLSEEEEEQNNALSQLSANVQMFPNPTDGAVVFTSMSKEKLFTKIEVYDLSGMQVASESFAETTSKSLNYNTLSKGIYVVKIFSDKAMVETQLLNLK